ncbi:pentatricopeptide repeat protein [Artemisia annua]|uniref:Pentatricopeptide repeat protein n=1 Tax=Artemisia annua TaxID=35608 RepID=A0A2U1PFG4_ARTAN|nr:pentatricopeptide repeat protein [Artemisia annua]
MLNLTSNSLKKKLLIIFAASKSLQKHESISTLFATHDQISRLILDQKTPQEALNTFKWASKQPHFTHSQSTYKALIHKLCLFRRFDIAHQMLDQMPTPPDEDIFITLVRGLGRARISLTG